MGTGLLPGPELRRPRCGIAARSVQNPPPLAVRQRAQSEGVHRGHWARVSPLGNSFFSCDMYGSILIDGLWLQTADADTADSEHDDRSEASDAPLQHHGPSPDLRKAADWTTHTHLEPVAEYSTGVYRSHVCGLRRAAQGCQDL